jgi:hypothetical protein
MTPEQQPLTAEEEEYMRLTVWRTTGEGGWSGEERRRLLATLDAARAREKVLEEALIESQRQFEVVRLYIANCPGLDGGESAVRSIGFTLDAVRAALSPQGKP